MDSRRDSGCSSTASGFPKGERLGRVLDAVGSTAWPSLGFQAEQGGPILATRMLASLLVHAYSQGRFASEEIEEACRTEGDFQYLCSSDAPDARVLRRFRRFYSPALIQSLAALWAEPVDGNCDPRRALGLQRAQACLKSAVEADSLALEF
ncbi:MAG: Transposase domain [Verrucomicrobiota bacterium]|jgi:hypothetical protein